MAPEQASWACLFDTCQAALLLLARQYTGCCAEAEDVVQEAFLRVIRGSQQPLDDPKPYMFAVVRNTAIDFAKRADRRKRREAGVAQNSDAEQMFKCPLEMEERRAAIEAALQGLPEDQRVVIALKVWSDLTSPQIAVALDTNERTVASRYQYAIAKLRKLLEGMAVE